MSGMTVTREALCATIAMLRRGGELGEERVALWLATAIPRAPVPVVEVYEPEQVARVDSFWLPAASMRRLLEHLRVTRRRIVAQVHSHPAEAYHSEADAEWAIVKHLGAFSLVLPRFAATTTPENFATEVAAYEYSRDGVWEPRSSKGPRTCITVVP